LSRWRRDVEIFLVSALILYLELALIRWLGTEVRILAYLGNLVLVVCFFGSGLGCYRADQPIVTWRLGANLLLLLGMIANPFHVPLLEPMQLTQWLSHFEDSLVWEYRPRWSTVEVAAAMLAMALLVYLLVFIFMPLGQLLGRSLARHPRIIRAYSVNIVGSLAGIWLFNGVSWASLPPVVWFGIVALLLGATFAVSGLRARAAVGLAVLGAVAVWMGRDLHVETIWSPYHRLTLQPWYAESVNGTKRVQQGYMLEVNGSFYQHMLNLSDEFVRDHADILNPELVARGHYNLPFAFQPKIDRMLVVGAGSGNDAAAALRHGARQVDCVEIDPRIYELGRKLHPEHPYDSPRVHVVIDDARAFFKRARGTYDIVWFGWLDSHTLGSSFNNLRLDHYVYTKESLAEARRLLTEDGVVILSFAVERRWVADRLVGMAREVFGHEPLAYVVTDIPRQAGGGGNLAVICGRKPVTLDRVGDPVLREYIRAHLIDLKGVTRPTTDDWPYLYLQFAKIPNLHLITSLAIVAAVALARRRAFGLKHGLDWHFFALGAAFLLLEVQTVSRATLLFGMTWEVNAIVISALLVMILLSNASAARWPSWPPWVPVLGLAVTVTALALVPLDWFNELGLGAKLVIASAFLTAPVFFSGLIFIRSFAVCEDKARALGSNLVGALFGGLLESLSFVTGLRALVLLVGLFYVIALVVRRPPEMKVRST